MNEWVLMFLLALPFVVIGFIAGVLYTRSVYKQTYRWQRRLILKQQRALAENKGNFYSKTG